jgi:hypothetical protein
MFWFVGESCPEGGRGCVDVEAGFRAEGSAFRQRVGLKSLEGQRYERVEALLVTDQDAESFDVQAAEGHSPQAMHGGYKWGGVGREGRHRPPSISSSDWPLMVWLSIMVSSSRHEVGPNDVSRSMK